MPMGPVLTFCWGVQQQFTRSAVGKCNPTATPFGRPQVGTGGRVGSPPQEVAAMSDAELKRELDELREHAVLLEEEVNTLRRRLQEAPKRVRTLEEKLLETKGQLAQAVSQNEKLTYTLREAREHI